MFRPALHFIAAIICMTVACVGLPAHAAASGAHFTDAQDDVTAAFDLLAQRLARMTEATLKSALASDHDEIRAAAAKAIGYKGSPLCKELGSAVRDKSLLVGKEAQATLVKLTGEDLGPAENASAAERFAAGQRWEKFLAEREKSQ